MEDRTYTRISGIALGPTTPGSKGYEIKVRLNIPTPAPVRIPVYGERETIIRRFRIDRKDFESIGYTPQCPGCKAIDRGFPAQTIRSYAGHG